MYDAIFDEDIELENYIVAGAPYGGAIGMMRLMVATPILMSPALLRDETKLYRFQDAATSRSNIDIYSLSGKYISRIHVCLLFSSRYTS